jgi:hypothetical protein
MMDTEAPLRQQAGDQVLSTALVNDNWLQSLPGPRSNCSHCSIRQSTQGLDVPYVIGMGPGGRWGTEVLNPVSGTGRDTWVCFVK